MTGREDGDSGRTYAIPFDRVWKAAIALADGGMEGWRLEGADDGKGVITARRDGALLRREADVRIEVGLDENAQTRVSLEARAADGRVDGRPGRRAIALFLGRLDEALGLAAPRAADAAGAPTWSS